MYTIEAKKYDPWVIYPCKLKALFCKVKDLLRRTKALPSPPAAPPEKKKKHCLSAAYATKKRTSGRQTGCLAQGAAAKPHKIKCLPYFHANKKQLPKDGGFQDSCRFFVRERM